MHCSLLRVHDGGKDKGLDCRPDARNQTLKPCTAACFMFTTVAKPRDEAVADAVIKSGAPLLIVMVLRLFSSQAPGEDCHQGLGCAGFWSHLHRHCALPLSFAAWKYGFPPSNLYLCTRTMTCIVSSIFDSINHHDTSPRPLPQAQSPKEFSGGPWKLYRLWDSRRHRRLEPSSLRERLVRWRR